MKTIKITLILFIVLISSNYSNGQTKKAELLKYSILKDEVYDAPIKTQVQLDILIEDTQINEQKIRDLLNYLYNKAIMRTGFKYHNNPTNVYIYVYTSKEKATSGMGQWIGMISKSYDDIIPNILISETQLKSLSLKPVEKFGISESRRLEIWEKSFLIEDVAQKEADAKYPLDKVGITMDDMKKNSALFNKLKKGYKKELALKYRIEITIIDSIVVEGFTKGWAIPKSK